MTEEARLARIRAGEERQRLYRENEWPAIRAERIANGLCVIEDGQCVTHGTVADFGHYLATQPSHTAQGFATND